MLETIAPSVGRWLPVHGTRWRASTWWPSDTSGSMQASLIQLLALAHRERLDAAPLVANLAEEHRGRYRRRLRRLAKCLAEGTSAVDALEQTPEALTDEDVLAIRFGTQTGTLDATYQSLLADSQADDDRASTTLRQTIVYSILTLIVLGLAISFLLTFIFPTLRMIHDEFGLVEKHPFYRVFLVMTDWLARHTQLLLLTIVIVAFLFWSIPSRRFLRRVLADRLTRGIAQSRSGQLLQLLSIAVEAGRPIPAAISTLARYHFDPCIRQKLLFARNEIEQGTDAWESLVEAGLLSREESVAIATASSTPSRAWTIEQLARRKSDQFSQRRGTRMQWLQPLVTFAFAAIVLIVAGAMIGYLAQMVQSLTAFV